MYNNYPPTGGYPNNCPQGGYGYAAPPDDGRFRLRALEKKSIRFVGCIAGCCVLGFIAVGFFISMTLDYEAYQRYSSEFAYQYAFDTLYAVLSVGLPFFAAYFFLCKRSTSELLPLGTPRNKFYFILIIPAAWLICILGSYATTMISMLFEYGFGIIFELPGTDLHPQNTGEMLLMIMRIAIAPALLEEVAMRGVVLQSLRRYGDWFAIFMSAAVFALMHGNMVQIPFAFIAGIALGYAVITTGSLWTGIIIHFLNNMLSVVQSTAYDTLSSADYEAFSRILIIAIGALGLVCGVVLYEKKMFRRLHSGSRALSTAEKAAAFFLNIPMLAALGYLIYTTSEYIKFV